MNIELEFYPRNTVYAVLNYYNTIEKAEVIQSTVNIYEDKDGYIIEKVQYLILLEKYNNTLKVTEDQLFSTLDEALDRVKTEFSGDEAT